VSENASEQDLTADVARQVASEEELIMGLARDRREGRETRRGVQEVLKRAARTPLK
jgi:hypothetical protein